MSPSSGKGILSGCFARGTRLKQAEIATAESEHHSGAIVDALREPIEAGWNELQAQLEQHASAPGLATLRIQRTVHRKTAIRTTAKAGRPPVAQRTTPRSNGWL